MRKNRRILIVDDEPYNILALQIILQKSGYPQIKEFIDSANNGQEAVQKVKDAFTKKQFSYRVIFMDLSMPILDGYEATKEIRNFLRQKGIIQPMIVACTGHTEEEFIKKAWDTQMDEVLQKPVNILIIKEIMQEIIK